MQAKDTKMLLDIAFLYSPLKHLSCHGVGTYLWRSTPVASRV